MKEKPYISVVSPVYKAEKIIEILVAQLIETLSKITKDFEIILVNDASPDNSWAMIVTEANKDNRVKGINFSRNFGQHFALTAGLDFAKGDWVIVMDCDLQDQPKEITKLYNKAQEGYDIVLGRRKNRQDKFFKKSFSIVYYSLLSYLTETKIDPSVGTFRIMSGNVVKSFSQMRESSRYFGAMINWLGFNFAFIDLEHNQRFEGKSSYTLKKAFELAINGVLSFSEKPLRLTIKFGFLIVLISSTFILYKVLQAYFFGTTELGWSSLIASIFFSSGIIVFVLGVIGLYIARIFEQVKQRPLYIIKETTDTVNHE